MSTVLIAERIQTGVQPRTVRVALAGCGVVGGNLVALLREHGAAIERSRGLRLEIVRVLVRDVDRIRSLPLPPHIITADTDTFLRTPADVVVEALGGRDPAERIACASLAAGRDFVTANKVIVAARGVALQELARRSRARFSFEAAVAGGVPVLRVLRDALVAADVRAVRGILNGTTNYILSRMERGASFQAALNAARANGFAEADPTRDLNGQDAADKVAILAWLAFGAEPATLPVHRAGLLPYPDVLVHAARAFDGTVRLLGECVRLQDVITANVEPVVVGAASPFAHVHGAENLIEVDSGWTGTLRFSGAGAGGGPTAAALLGDLLTAPASLAAHGPHTVAGVADPRPFRWVLSARADAGARDSLLAVAATAGFAVVDVRAEARSGTVHVLTARCLRAQVEAAAATLRAQQRDVAYSRYAVDEDA